MWGGRDGGTGRLGAGGLGGGATGRLRGGPLLAAVGLDRSCFHETGGAVGFKSSVQMSSFPFKSTVTAPLEECPLGMYLDDRLLIK